MRLLDRYLLRELLIPLGYCLCGFLIFFIAFDLISQLHAYQEHKLQFQDVAELYAVKIPEILVFILPIVLLLALLYALTNHARHHELTAIRAAGVGLWRICAPYLIVGFLLSLAVFAMNELWVPDNAAREEQIMGRRDTTNGPVDKNVVLNVAFKNSRDGRDWKIDRIDFNSPACRMTGITVISDIGNGGELWLVADRCERINDVWTFYNVHEYAATNATSPSQILVTNVLAAPEFSETPGQIKREVGFASRFNKPSIDSAGIPVAELLDYLDLHRHDLPAHKKWSLYTQLHGRLAAPWTCLVVVLIAIPFGAASGRRNIFVGVAGSIVICFIYFVLLKLGLGAWAPAGICRRGSRRGSPISPLASPVSG